MHKREIIPITAFFFLAVLMGFFYFNEEVNITGAATTETNQKNIFYGTYSIKPSFKTSVDYDLEEYGEIVGKAKELYKICSEHYDLRTCILNKLILYNGQYKKEAKEKNTEKRFEWSLDCGTEEEKFFYDFVEKYKLCFDSKEDGICEFSLAEGFKNKKFYIKLSNEFGKTKFELINEDSVIEIKEIVDITGLYIVDNEGKKVTKVSDLNNAFQNYIHVYISFNRKGKVTTNVKGEVLSKKKESEKAKTSRYEGMIRLYKSTENKKTKISFIEDLTDNDLQLLVLDGKIQKYKPIKDTFKFCVKSPKKFYVYDEEIEKPKLKNVQYRFALKFIDKTPPPPIENIEIKDKLRDEDSVLVLWNKSKANDVREYLIFYSQENFKEEEVVYNKKNKKFEIKNTKHIKLVENEKIEIEDIDLSECKFDPIGEPCKYAKYNKPLLKGNLYYNKSNKIYVVIVDGLKDGVDYNFMVVAVDFNGNVIDNEKQKFMLKNDKLPSGKSIDDLNPDIINTIKKESSGKTFTLSWDREIYNLDGRLAVDIESFNIYYKAKDSDKRSKFEKDLDRFGRKVNRNYEQNFYKYKHVTIEETNCKGPSIECEYAISKEFAPGIYLWGVTALDEAGNEHDYVFVKDMD